MLQQWLPLKRQLIASFALLQVNKNNVDDDALARVATIFYDTKTENITAYTQAVQYLHPSLQPK